MNNNELKHIAENLIPTAENAGKTSIDLYNKGIKITIKPDNSPVISLGSKSSFVSFKEFIIFKLVSIKSYKLVTFSLNLSINLVGGMRIGNFLNSFLLISGKVAPLEYASISGML